jgi:nanoRNase/pAp phosphatase (c-di-AMP/oligoRNAs hydrolase)
MENNPTYVANVISDIIYVMISSMPYESRYFSYSSINEKINDMNIMEISNKKSPGGAPIGASISLIKNILNSKDPYFIKLVLDELSKKLTSGLNIY